MTSSSFDGNNHQTATGWSFDVSGNLTADPIGTSYGYDAENRMVSATSTLSGRAIYQYDGDGQRVVRVVCVSSNPCLSTSSDAVTTTYVYDAQGELAAEYKSCTTAVNCVDGSPPPATEYLTADHLGNTRLVTDGSVNPVECRDYLPFGEEILLPTNGTPRQGVPCLTQDGRVRQLFTGKERDAETGLDNFGARYLSSAQGRFTSPDQPLADQQVEYPQSWNLYTYGRNNPLINIDPTGRTCVTVTHSDGSSNQVDNGDRKGCIAAGVKPSENPDAGTTTTSDDDKRDITPQQADSQDKLPNLLWLLNPLNQLRVDIDTLKIARSAKVCGGGGFGYLGRGFNFGWIHAELLGLLEYDSQEGGAHGALLGAGVGPFTVGFESMRYWRNWQSRTTPIGLGGHESKTNKKLGGANIGKIAAGGLAQLDGNNFNVGGYGGAGIAGGGGYVTLRWTDCH